MGEIKRFEDLKVWQKSHELVLEVYKVTKQIPNKKPNTSNLKNEERTEITGMLGQPGIRIRL